MQSTKDFDSNPSLRQGTLKAPISCSGVALHSGAKTKMSLKPAPEDHGIVFRRTDLEGGGAEIRATWDNAIETPLCTTLVGPDEIKVATIEHLMSALVGAGIDNVLIEINGAEVPIMDGSAQPFLFLIECAGRVEQSKNRRALKILRDVEEGDEKRTASIAPHDGFSVTFEIDFDSTVITRQFWSMEFTPENYRRDIARARTFGFLHEVDKLREMGLARGGSLDNAIVISGDSILNDDGLRFDDEFVRHKVLDSIGDLYLAGGPVIGHFHGVRAGHALTLRLLKKVFSDKANYAWIDMEAATKEESTKASSAPLHRRAVAAPA